MATVRPSWRAKFTADITSATSAQRTIAAGRRSIIPLYTLRAASYSRLAGLITLPRIAGDNLLRVSLSILFGFLLLKRDLNFIGLASLFVRAHLNYWISPDWCYIALASRFPR